jgi:hypothetical protein
LILCAPLIVAGQRNAGRKPPKFTQDLPNMVTIEWFFAQYGGKPLTLAHESGAADPNRLLVKPPVR